MMHFWRKIELKIKGDFPLFGIFNQCKKGNYFFLLFLKNPINVWMLSNSWVTVKRPWERFLQMETLRLQKKKSKRGEIRQKTSGVLKIYLYLPTNVFNGRGGGRRRLWIWWHHYFSHEKIFPPFCSTCKLFLLHNKTNLPNRHKNPRFFLNPERKKYPHILCGSLAPPTTSYSDFVNWFSWLLYYCGSSRIIGIQLHFLQSWSSRLLQEITTFIYCCNAT